MGKNKIFLIVPELSFIGGTELEALITARSFLDDSKYEVIIFSTDRMSNELKEITRDWNINYQFYPGWFKIKIFKTFNKFLKFFFKRNGRNYSPFYFFYWFIQSIKNRKTLYYIITDSAQFYYAPVLANLDPKKVILKFTNCFEHTNWDIKHKAIIENCKAILVTSSVQKEFFEEKFGIQNLKVIDVFIWNEQRLLKNEVQREKVFLFGMLCRISRQKQLEDGIRLVWNLFEEGYNVKLKIKGPSTDKDYLDQLQTLITDLKAEGIIELDTEPILPEKAPEFYRNINCLLITSLFEGGPNTGLESMAAGVPILSYDVGAMGERLSPFKEMLIGSNFSTLKEKAVKLILLEGKEFINLGEKLKEHYIQGYKNKNKIDQTLTLFSEARSMDD